MKLGQRAPLLAMGIGIAVWGWFGIIRVGRPIRDKAIASAVWPSVTGRIVHSQQKRNLVPGEGDVVVLPDIGYEYELDGAAFSGHRVWIGDDSQPPWFDSNLPHGCRACRRAGRVRAA